MATTAMIPQLHARLAMMGIVKIVMTVLPESVILAYTICIWLEANATVNVLSAIILLSIRLQERNARPAHPPAQDAHQLQIASNAATYIISTQKQVSAIFAIWDRTAINAKLPLKLARNAPLVTIKIKDGTHFEH